MSDGRSPWVYVGLGCGCLALLILIGVVVLGFLGFRSVQNLKETVEDPVKRAAETLDILGCDAPPEGYEPAIGISVPLMMRMALLTDVPLDEHVDLGDSATRVFVYLRVANWVKADDTLGRVFADGGNPAAAFRRWNMGSLGIRGREEISEGTVFVGEQEVRYAAQRGRLSMDDDGFDGIVAVVVVECEGARDGLAAWVAPDPDPDASIDELDLSGTPADPETLTTFLSHFDLCR